DGHGADRAAHRPPRSEPGAFGGDRGGGRRPEAIPAGGAGAPGPGVLPLTSIDPLAAVRAEFAAGLAVRIETLRAALNRLERGFRSEDAQALYRAAHSLTGTAASFGAEGLAHVASDLEDLARSWLERGVALPEEWSAAAAAVGELDL